jgi:protease-4
MTDPQGPTPAPLNPFGSSPPAGGPPPRPSVFGAFFSWLGRLVLALTTLVNLVFVLLVLAVLAGLFSGFGKTDGGLRERLESGNKTAKEKVAVIRIEGVLFEGLTSYALNQIDAVAADDSVKAVVVRINSPGGTITASEELHKRLNDLRNGQNAKHPGPPRPVVVSMASVAASGGYYIAMIKGKPETVIFAEPTTLTGSIGVYTSLPNVEKLAKDHGIEVKTIKAGDLKASGSLFKKMSDKEVEVWQHMVDQSYLRFLQVIEDARPKLTKDYLQEDIVIKETLRVRSGEKREKKVDYTRYLADGGVYTSDQAKKYHLVDKIGYLNDAIEEAARQANLTDYKAIAYNRPPSLLGSLLGIKEGKTPMQLDAEHVANAAAPRLWYLAPQHEMAGFLTALGD